jgi:hypothetical protein
MKRRKKRKAMIERTWEICMWLTRPTNRHWALSCFFYGTGNAMFIILFYHYRTHHPPQQRRHGSGHRRCAATNRIDILDPALLRSGQLDCNSVRLCVPTTRGNSSSMYS